MSFSVKCKATFENIFAHLDSLLLAKISYLENVDTSWEMRSELGMRDFKRTPSAVGNSVLMIL